MKYVDLGLPSGTLWSESTEEGFYTFDEAVEKYGDSLPTREQFIELRSQCKWEWMGDGYKVTGPNGNSIVLHAKGFRDDNGNMYGVGSIGNYWSSTPYLWDDACGFYFYSSGAYMNDHKHCIDHSVRLVK